ncbi:cystatin-C [Phascolarctos cinereus]|uniref:Cystatin-C-like n=1 Tax=Phascolarctos cinereus TaxID=38626 RepID=A0A6P5KE16_PHACI|nr:cystatin-C-like [Phascolarctos cinereus]
MAGPRSFLLLPLLLLALVLAVQAQERLPRLLGGLMEADQNDEGVQQALGFALREFNRASNDKFGSRVFRVVRVRKQVVSGLKYYIDAEIRRTTCDKSVADLSSCPYHKDPALKKHSICEFQVYSVPWMGKTSLLKSECKDA